MKLSNLEELFERLLFPLLRLPSWKASKLLNGSVSKPLILVVVSVVGCYDLLLFSVAWGG